MKQKQLPRSSTHSIASTLAFRSLLSLLGCSLLMGGLLHFKIHTIPTSSSILKPASSSQESHLLPPPHLVPKLPYLPPFPTIENDEELIYQTLHRNQPTIAGIAAILYRFLQALHSSNVRFSKLLGHATAEDIRAEYFRLAYQHLVPLDRAYDGRPIFSIRRDDSIYVSVAAFREYLLAETLMSAFEHAAHPERLFVGVIVQNCFLGEKCQKGTKVVGKDRNGKDVLEVIDGIPDPNHIESFCTNSTTFRKYCDNGQVRVLYVNETDALGPAAARYYSSKLWGGETYYVQIDSHLQFAHGWDELYIQDLKLTKNFPKSILSTYPPGFVNFRQYPPFTPGTRLCKCQIRATEGWLVRVEMNGRCHENETRPTQMSFMGAGFFFAPAEFLVDVPYDPFLPYLFMGEEVALSIRTWTSGYNIYAPRKNLIGHQYRPYNMGTPHYWDTISEYFHQPTLQDVNEREVRKRIKYMMGYPEVRQGLSFVRLHNSITTNATNDDDNGKRFMDVLLEVERYGLGNVRSPQDYLNFAEIDLDQRTCGAMKWCSEGELE